MPVSARLPTSPPQPAVAASAIHEENPGELVVRCFSERTNTSPVNPRLGFASVGFTRFQGDWLGVVITPQCIDLMLLPGGGSLWGDVPPGQRRYIDLPHQTVAFVATEDPQIGPYQHAAVVADASSLTDMVTAVRLAEQVMAGICGTDSSPALVLTAADRDAGAVPGLPATTSRRAFFRRLAGKR